jgi:hypothetical protein
MSELEPASRAEDAVSAAAAEAEDEGADVSAAGDRSRPTCDSERVDEASQESVLGFCKVREE